MTEATHLPGVDVPARAVHVRVVREDDVHRRARDLRDRGARVARDDDVRHLAVLPGDAEAQFLYVARNSQPCDRGFVVKIGAHLAHEEVRAVRVDDSRIHFRELIPAHL